MLKDIFFEVKKGLIYVLLGINGVGKIMILKIILGLFKLILGCVVIDGKEMDLEEGG